MPKDKILNLEVSERFITFANELKQPCDQILREVSEVLPVMPHPYREQLERGRSISDVLRGIFQLAHVGRSIDEQLRKALKLDGFVMEDSDILLGETYMFWYVATRECKVNLTGLRVWVEEGSASLAADRSIRDKVDEVKELLADPEMLARATNYQLDDHESYEFEVNDELQEIVLSIQDLGLDNLPDVHQLSRLFDKIEKKASARSQKRR